MTFIADESSTESSTPREGIELVLPTTTYRFATGTRNVTIAGQTFVATPSSRVDLSISQVGQDTSPSIYLPAKHAFVERFMASGVPPRLVLVNIYRQQAGGDYEVVWRGRISVVSFNEQVARFSVPSRTLTLLERKLPNVSVSRSCPHILYDANCQVDRAGFQIDTTITDVDGRVVKVTPIGALLTSSGWATGGEILHPTTGERMTISDQTGAVLTLRMPLGQLVVGESVSVFAGCTHTVDICRDKFSNRVNFGGYPQLVTLVNKPNGTKV